MLSITVAQYLQFPAVFLRIDAVHAEQITSKQRCFITTGTGAYFKKNIALVIRVFRDQKNTQGLLVICNRLHQPIHLFCRHFAHFNVFVFKHLLRCFELMLSLLPLLIAFDDRRQF